MKITSSPYRRLVVMFAVTGTLYHLDRKRWSRNINLTSNIKTTCIYRDPCRHIYAIFCKRDFIRKSTLVICKPTGTRIVSFLTSFGRLVQTKIRFLPSLVEISNHKLIEYFRVSAKQTPSPMYFAYSLMGDVTTFNWLQNKTLQTVLFEIGRDICHLF